MVNLGLVTVPVLCQLNAKKVTFLFLFENYYTDYPITKTTREIARETVEQN